MAEVQVTGDPEADTEVDAEVTVSVGDDVVIRLPENATTGYVWTVHAVGDGLELVEDTMVPPGVVAPGADGERLVRVRATAPTRADVVLRLARPWEAEPVQAQRVTVVAADRTAGSPR
jgi:inhibitor of cysteine peptidase